MRCAPNGNHASARSRSTSAGTLSTRPSLAPRPCREIGSVLIPGTKTAGPTPRHIHARDHRVFAANMANEIDGAVDQHPPEVRILALVKQLDTGLDRGPQYHP